LLVAVCSALFATSVRAEESLAHRHELLIPPGTARGISYRLDDGSHLVVRLLGPDVAGIWALLRHGEAPTVANYDHVLQGWDEDELHIPRAAAGTWFLTIHHTNTSLEANEWAQRALVDKDVSIYKVRPFPNNADHKVTVELSSRPAKGYPAGKALRVTTTNRK